MLRPPTQSRLGRTHMVANRRTLPSNISLVCPRCDSITNVEFLEMESDTVEYAGICQGRLEGELCEAALMLTMTVPEEEEGLEEPL